METFKLFAGYPWGSVAMYTKGNIVLETQVLYEVGIEKQVLVLRDGSEKNYPETLSNGRANYIVFEWLVRDLAGLTKTTGSDSKDSMGRTYEQKAYKDPEIHPNDGDLFRVSSSSTFGANNHGPTVNRLVRESKYDEAFSIVNETGYSKNDFYILTNTGGYSPSIPLRFVILEKDVLVANLDDVDPRLISKDVILNKIIKSKIVLI